MSIIETPVGEVQAYQSALGVGEDHCYQSTIHVVNQDPVE